MKNLSTFFVAAALAAATAACSSDEKLPAAAPERGNVAFVMRTPQQAAPYASTDDFRVLTFKQDASGDYTYLTDIPLGGMSYDGSTLKGSAQLAAGEYKFVPTYGVAAADSFTWPALDGAVLNADLAFTHTAGSFPAAFLLNVPAESVDSYTISLDGPRQTVSATLRRSVSRVDVLFIRADKDASGYTEKAGDDVFGPEKLAKVEMEYTDANSRLGLTGEKIDGTFDVTHTISAPMDYVTMGTGTATTLSRDGYNFDDVLAADIISGSAHLEGTYLIPNKDNTPTTSLTMHLTSGEGTPRTITVEKLPVERNKVTLVRIYVLGDNVFTTAVDFAVELDTVWDGSNFVDGEID